VIVDVHRHVIPDGIVKAMAAGQLRGIRLNETDGRRTVEHDEGYSYPLIAEFHEPEALAAALQRSGADAAVLAPAPPLFGYGLPQSEAVAQARAINDGIATLVSRAGVPVVGLATLPMGFPPLAAEELRRATSELGLVGAEIGARVGELALDDPQLSTVLETANEIDALLFVHPHYTGPRPGLEEMYLTNLVGNPLDTSVCAARLILSGVLDRLPRLRILLAHGGGFLPYQIGRLDHGDAVRPELGRCIKRPSWYLRRFAYDTVLHAPQPLEFLIALVGADRVAFGTDAPFDMRAGSLEQQTGGLRLDPALRAAVSSGTATQFLGIRPPAMARSAAAISRSALPSAAAQSSAVEARLPWTSVCATDGSPPCLPPIALPMRPRSSTPGAASCFQAWSTRMCTSWSPATRAAKTSLPVRPRRHFRG
jgi:aminocarboxymuconate-semialdehyde decarboxylase